MTTELLAWVLFGVSYLGGWVFWIDRFVEDERWGPRLLGIIWPLLVLVGFMAAVLEKLIDWLKEVLND